MLGSLRGLDPRSAERVARHLVAAGTLIDEDPGSALAHARAARDRASRIPAVREAVGVAAYHAGDYAEAARELRAYRRMSGDQGYRAVLADCERALGRPEVALRLVGEALSDGPDADEAVELHLVEAGARHDLGESAAARLVLEGALGSHRQPGSLGSADAGTLRLASAYADLLRDEGEDELAEAWLAAIAAADPEDSTGALERLGVAFEETDPEDGAEGTRRDPSHFDPDRSFSDEVDAVGEAGGLDAPAGSDEADAAGEAGGSDQPSGAGGGFEAEVEAEVAELLGESEPAIQDGDTARH